MNASIHQSLAAFAMVGSLLVGCASQDQEAQAELGVSGLTETRSFVACSPQVLTVASDASSDPDNEYTWNVTAPDGAAFSSMPNANVLQFTARTPGEYLISVSACSAIESSAVDCQVTEFSVTVEMGADLDHNGVGDLCQSVDCTPDCGGRECGVDPVCGQSCGTCGAGESCDESSGQCEAECQPDCAGRTCGVDPVCGKSCGTCGAGETCDEAAGQCQTECVPACAGRTCGLDPICHSSCGTCGDGTACNSEGTCEAAAPAGRVVTMLMALTDPRLSFTDPHFHQRTRLIEQAVQWVSPVPNPKVLVVLDDTATHRNREAQRIAAILIKRGFSATLVTEPNEGLTDDQLSAYDVVWFSNPDLSIDDATSIAALKSFAHAGGGLVLQGDNMSQPAELEPLTGLHNVSDGKYYCGLYIDDDRGASYRVNVERIAHPIVAELRGNHYYYGNDIDASTLVPNAQATVLAWAQGSSCQHRDHRTSKCGKQPVIVANELE